MIHNEWITNLLRNRPDLSPEQLARTRATMDRAFPGALVHGFEKLISTLCLPDPGDRHVVAAALVAGAEVIVTFNLQDFPRGVLVGLGLCAAHPDSFVLGLCERHPERVRAAAARQRLALRNPPVATEQYLATLARANLPRTSAGLRCTGT